MATTGNMFINLAALAAAVGVTQEKLMEDACIGRQIERDSAVELLRIALQQGKNVPEIFCWAAGHFVEPISL